MWMIGDTVSWLVAVCPRVSDAGPLVVHQHRRYGRVAEVIEGGVLVEGLPLGPPGSGRGWQMRDFYVSLQPGADKPVWLCDGTYRIEGR